MRQVIEMTDSPIAPYLALIRRRCPDFAFHQARLLTSSGQFNTALCLDERWIFRFPKSRHAAAEVAQELEILPRLQGMLPLPIPNPVRAAWHPDSGRLEWMAYVMLPGEPLLRGRFAALTEAAVLERIALDLATFLKVLHGIPAASIGLNKTPPEDSRQAWRRIYADIQEQLYPYMRAAARAEVSRGFARALNDESLWQVENRLVHGDFGTGNILYQDGRISGIIDFTFCGLSDPAQDLGALIASYGEPFVERALRHYPDLRRCLPRARFYQRHYALIQALYALRDNDPDEFEDGIAAYR